MEENDKIIELDENKIENLDEDLKNDKSSTDDEINLLKSKVKKLKIINIVKSIFIVFCLLIFVGIGVLYYLYANEVKPLFSSYFLYKQSIASVSQISEKNKIDLDSFTKKLAFVDDVVNMLYYYDKDNKKIEDAMFTGYLNALGDKYAQYFPAKEFEEFTEKTTEGVYYGIGCLVTQDRETMDASITQIYEDSPAEKGGLMVGDVFVSIDGVHVRGDSLDSIVEKIKGPEGAERKIEVFRVKTGQNLTLTCYCGKVDIKLVNTKILDNNIGYIDIDEFTGKASSQFKKAVDKMMDAKVDGLILDLRSNAGGELITILEMLDYLVKDNDGRYTLNQVDTNFDPGKTLLVYIKEKDQIVDAAYAEDGHSVELPMVVLTDYGTASAAELFTEALNDYKKATLVGSRTYGKGVVQNIIPYEDGSAIKFTVSEYFPPSGYSIDKRGILPDYSLDINGEEVLYDKDHNIVVYDNDKKYILNVDGSIKEEIDIKNATISELKSTPSTPKYFGQKEAPQGHRENLKIYDYENEFLDEEWFQDLDNEYDDKQLLQAILIMKDKLGTLFK